ncbi:MAG: UPF0175 family protein [Chitinophagales bacterium]
MQDFIISAAILEELKISPSKLKIDLAIYLYDKEQLSMGRAKKLAGLTQIEFQKEMAKRGVYIKYDVADFMEDLETLKKIQISQ